MEIILDKDGEIQRKQVWVTAWLKIASCVDCKEARVATNWADICLKGYDERFNKQPVEQGKIP